jgi:hypothetical protein
MTNWWLSSEKMTVSIEVGEDSIVRDASPIARKFQGQPLANLVGWMRKQGGLRMEELPEPSDSHDSRNGT